MADTPTPDLFARVPHALLAPLASPLAPLYWSVLARLYQYEFEREPFNIVKPIAAEIAEREIEGAPLWKERREALLSPAFIDAGADMEGDAVETEPLRLLARRIVTRLEQTGWFHFEYRSHLGLVLNFYPYAARLLEALMRVARDEQPLFQGYAHAIATLLRSDSFAAKPGLSLREAKRQTLELVRELKILNRNIYAFTQRLLDQAATPEAVLEEGVDRYHHAVQANYHRLKTVDNLYNWRSDILLRLEQIERDRAALESAAAWYAEQNTLDPASAPRQPRDDLHVIRTQFETMPEITDDIDQRNARFSGVALRKLNYLLRQDKRIEGQLEYLIEALAHDRAPELEFELYHCLLLSDQFLYTPPQRRQAVAARALPPRKTLSADQTERIVAALKSSFSLSRIQAYVAAQLAGRASMPLAEIPLEDDADYIRRIFIVAFGLEPHTRYRFRWDREANQPVLEWRGDYGYPRGVIEAQRGKRDGG